MSGHGGPPRLRTARRTWLRPAPRLTRHGTIRPRPARRSARPRLPGCRTAGPRPAPLLTRHRPGRPRSAWHPTRWRLTGDRAAGDRPAPRLTGPRTTRPRPAWHSHQAKPDQAQVTIRPRPAWPSDRGRADRAQKHKVQARLASFPARLTRPRTIRSRTTRRLATAWLTGCGSSSCGAAARRPDWPGTAWPSPASPRAAMPRAASSLRARSGPGPVTRRQRVRPARLGLTTRLRRLRLAGHLQAGPAVGARPGRNQRGRERDQGERLSRAAEGTRTDDRRLRRERGDQPGRRPSPRNAIAAYQSGHTNAATASTGTASATGPPISAITTQTRPRPIQADSGGADGLNRWPAPRRQRPLHARRRRR